MNSSYFKDVLIIKPSQQHCMQLVIHHSLVPRPIPSFSMLNAENCETDPEGKANIDHSKT